MDHSFDASALTHMRTRVDRDRAYAVFAVRAVPGVTSVEKCRVRKSGFMRFADIHVRVAGDCTVREGHDIAHLVKNSLLEGNFHLADVIVHIEPETHDDATRPRT